MSGTNPISMMHFIFLVMFAVLGTLRTAGASDVIDLSVVAAAAFAKSEVVKSAQKEFEAIQELYPQATANWKPTIDANASIVQSDVDNSNFGAGDGATTKQYGVSLDQPLYRGGRSVAQKREAKARIRAEYQNYTSIGQQEIENAITTAIQAVFEKKNLDIQIKNENIYNELLATIIQRRMAGEVTDTDIALTQTRLSSAIAARLLAETRLDNALTDLEQKTGMAPYLWQGIAPFTVPLPATLQDAVAMARAHNPDITSANHLIEAERQVAQRIDGELYPRVGFFANWNRSLDPSPGIVKDSESSEIGVQATIPLYEGGATRARARQARSRTEGSRYSALDVAVRIEKEVIESWRQLQSARLRRTHHEAELSAAEKARLNTAIEVRAGEKALTDLLQADQAWLDASVSTVGAARDALQAHVRLAALLGLLKPQALGLAQDMGDHPYP